MKNTCIYLWGILTVCVIGTIQGAPHPEEAENRVAAMSDSAIRTDSAIRARRVLRIYQTLDMPFARTLDKRSSTSSTAAYYENDLDKYPSNDLRNAFTGVVDGLTVTERSGMPGLHYGEESLRGSITSRGFTPTFVVDGMPIYLSQLQLDPEEIESMTFVRDIADKALFGSRASGGVINITTRRGHPGERRIRVGFESGVSVVDRSPEWVNGV